MLIKTTYNTEHERDSDSNCSWCPWNGVQRPGKNGVGIGDQRKNRDFPVHSTMEISLNTLKNPEDLIRLAIAQN